MFSVTWRWFWTFNVEGEGIQLEAWKMRDFQEFFWKGKNVLCSWNFGIYLDIHQSTNTCIFKSIILQNGRCNKTQFARGFRLEGHPAPALPIWNIANKNFIRNVNASLKNKNVTRNHISTHSILNFAHFVSSIKTNGWTGVC